MKGLRKALAWFLLLWWLPALFITSGLGCYREGGWLGVAVFGGIIGVCFLAVGTMLAGLSLLDRD